ncbi:MAG: ABC transporter ATP-binding protein [Senegalia sp. (in: firmicutes)]
MIIAIRILGDIMDKILSIENLKVEAKVKGGKIDLVDQLSMEIGQGQIVGLVGESGCGKSMTALSIVQLLPKNLTSQGHIYLGDQDLLALNKKEIRKIRGSQVSMIFQEPLRALNPLNKVGHQIEEVLKIHTDLSRSERKKEILDIFDRIGLKDLEEKYHSYPHQLSGGINQRIMIAIATILKAKLLIADEPTTALDVTIQSQILKLMKRLRDENQTSILLITHDLAVVAETCDWVYVMYAGQIVESSDVRSLFEKPKHPYTKALIKSIPRVERKVEKLYSIEGTVPNLADKIEGCRFYSRCSQREDRCSLENIELYQLGNSSCRCIKYKENSHD